MRPAGKPGRKFLYYGCGLFRPRVSPAKREHILFALGKHSILVFFRSGESSVGIVRIPCSHTLFDACSHTLFSFVCCVLTCPCFLCCYSRFFMFAECSSIFLCILFIPLYSFVFLCILSCSFVVLRTPSYSFDSNVVPVLFAYVSVGCSHTIPLIRASPFAVRIRALSYAAYPFDSFLFFRIP